MPTWDTIRNKAVAGLSNVAQEGSRQARLAKLNLQLGDVKGRQQEALRELGEAVFRAREAGTALDDIAPTLQPIWDKLADLTKKHEELQAAVDSETPAGREAPSSAAEAVGNAAEVVGGAAANVVGSAAEVVGGAAVAGRFCDQCGSAIAPEARFCSACGSAASA